MIPLPVILPELILILAACALFLVGSRPSAGARRVAPLIALLALVLVFGYMLPRTSPGRNVVDPTGTFRVDDMAHYIKMIAAGVGVLFVLLSWPTNKNSSANSSLSVGTETGEYFALMLLSISGIFIVAGANDIILLFLGIELASIPTYIMVSISRPLPVAQEAGVKYFFLGAMAAALLLFGLSYLYGVTGMTNISEIAAHFSSGIRHTPRYAAVYLTPWETLAALMVIVGITFKLAAVPMHFYAADVYQGAATPVTALLSFVPKASGFVALIKIVYAFGGGEYALPAEMIKVLWILAVFTMTIGNVLGLLQLNVKRVLAYSSVAHSGYMLTGVTVLAAAHGDAEIRQAALAGILFYLAAYGITNAGAFGVLQLLPARATRRFGSQPIPVTDELPEPSAETYEDIAGTGRKHPGLGLAMAVSCFSLIGLPLTVGFFAKFFLIAPALKEGQIWLVVLVMANAAIGAAYYLKIIATMFLRPEPAGMAPPAPVVPEAPSAANMYGRGMMAGDSPQYSYPTYVAVCLSIGLTLFFGIIFPATFELSDRAHVAATPALSFSSTPSVAAAPQMPVAVNSVR